MVKCIVCIVHNHICLKSDMDMCKPTYLAKAYISGLVVLVWECHNGQVPLDHVVKPKDDNYANACLDNLECKTPEEFIGAPFKAHPIYSELLCTESGGIYTKKTLKARWVCTDELHFPYVTIGRQQINIRVCRLIYEAFNGLLPEHLDVFYKDGNRSNNALGNLTAVTPKDYMNAKALAILAHDSSVRRHPKYCEFIAHPDGRVYSLLSGIFVGSLNADGYRILRKGLSVHKIVYEAFHGIIDSKKYQIDHVNQVRDDNRITNLQKLTFKQHILKTRADNPTAVKQAGRSLSLPLMRLYYKDGHIVSSVAFDNIQEALKKTLHLIPDLTVRRIGQSIHSTCIKRNGYIWRREDCEDLPEEEWRVVPTYPGLQASTLGRIKFTSGRRTFGCCSGTSNSVTHNSKTLSVHILVCLAFHAHPTYFGDPKFSVDHRNRMHKDNRSANLRWSTKREQILNRSNISKIEAVSRTTGQVLNVFDTYKEAATFYKVGNNVVSKSIQGLTNSSRKLPDILFRKHRSHNC